MAVTTEIAPNIYRISIFAQWGNLQFNHFLVKDDEPLLFHTGLRGMHAEIREAVSKLIPLSDLRHVSPVSLLEDWRDSSRIVGTLFVSCLGNPNSL
jgi:hypothetical protein